jgi:hypothetical protein
MTAKGRPLVVFKKLGAVEKHLPTSLAKWRKYTLESMAKVGVIESGSRIVLMVLFTLLAAERIRVYLL